VPEDSGYAWETATLESVNINRALMTQAVAFAANPAQPLNAPLRSLLVIRHGKLVVEQYFNNWTPALANNMKSASKSMMGLVFGVVFQKGWFTSQEKLYNYFQDIVGTNIPAIRLNITLLHTLNMASGIYPYMQDDGVNFFSNETEWIKAILSQRMIDQPGAKFHYDTGMTHIMGRVLERITNVSLSRCTRELLLDALGIEVLRWDVDPQVCAAAVALEWSNELLLLAC
jgi:CubicO group peptidase (beta-lactamase class C family)